MLDAYSEQGFSTMAPPRAVGEPAALERRDGMSRRATISSSTRVPNFYFHFTTAYAILRSQRRLSVGKRDYLGARTSGRQPAA